MARDSQLSTVNNALDVLEFMSSKEGPVRLSDISKSLDLPKSNVHRLLHTLTNRGYVKQDSETLMYSLSTSSWLLGRSLEGFNLFIEVMGSFLTGFSEKINETTFLSTLQQKSVRYLFTKSRPNPLGIVLQEGSHVPVHSTASGKALLTHQSEEYIDHLIKDGLEKYTEYTIVERDSLLKEIDLTRRHGYALELEETHIGMSAIATTLTTQFGDIVAMGIFLPISRSKINNLEYLIQELLTLKNEVLIQIKRNCG